MCACTTNHVSLFDWDQLGAGSRERNLYTEQSACVRSCVLYYVCDKSINGMYYYAHTHTYIVQNKRVLYPICIFVVARMYRGRHLLIFCCVINNRIFKCPQIVFGVLFTLVYVFDCLSTSAVRLPVPSSTSRFAAHCCCVYLCST